MRVRNLAPYLISVLLSSVFHTIVPTACASKIYRTLEHHASSKDRKKSSKNKGDTKKSDDTSMDYLHHSMSMDIPVMSLDMSFYMSYPGGKGKGKGGKKQSHKSSKSAKKGSKSEKKSKSKSSSESSSGKEKGSNHSPTGKGGTVHPAPTPSSLDESERPPSSIPPAPAPSQPSSTPGGNPEESALQEVKLPSYGIAYTLANNMMPMREDYLEVEDITDTFFRDYMLNVFDEPAGSSLVQFRTTLQTSEFRFDDPVLIVYDSTAYFSTDVEASSLPSPQTLETLLKLSLEDSSEYLDLLMGLGSENAFSNTISVGFDAAASSTTTRSPQSGNSGASAATIAAGAVGAALLLAGVVLYRRRNMQDDEDYFSQKNLNSKNRDGGATVAGETYAGETYDGTLSCGDEEQGLVNVNLDEPSVSMEARSVSSSWEGLSSDIALNDGESGSDCEDDMSEGSHENEDEDLLIGAKGRSDSAGVYPGSDLTSMNENHQTDSRLDKKEDTENDRVGDGSDHADADEDCGIDGTAENADNDEDSSEFYRPAGKLLEESSAASGNDKFEIPSYAAKSLEAFDAYLEPNSASMSFSSQENEQNEGGLRGARQPLSVAEIEAMLNTSFETL